MKPPISYFSLSLVSLAIGLSGCATRDYAARKSELSTVPVHTSSSNSMVAESVNVSPSEDGFYVHGKVEKQFGYSLRQAHVRVRLMDANNELRQETVTSINPKHIPVTRQAKRGQAYYIAKLTESINEGDSIEVQVHGEHEHFQ